MGLLLGFVALKGKGECRETSYADFRSHRTRRAFQESGHVVNTKIMESRWQANRSIVGPAAAAPKSRHRNAQPQMVRLTRFYLITSPLTTSKSRLLYRT